jgi:hypothetical protein
MRKKRNAALLLCLLVFCISSNLPVFGEDVFINTPDGLPLFRYIFFDLGEQFGTTEYDYNPTGGATDKEKGISTWTLNDGERNALKNAGGYWASLLGSVSKAGDYIPVYIGTFDDDNADALSIDGTEGYTKLGNALLGWDIDPVPPPYAQIRIGRLSGQAAVFSWRPCYRSIERGGYKRGYARKRHPH